MKKSYVLISVLMVAILGFATMSWAQEASVFDDVEKIIIRAYITGPDVGSGMYSAYLEVRDDNGAIISPTMLVVTHDSAPFPISTNPFQIHDNDLVNQELSIAIDNETGTVYAFCTDETEGLHVMKFNISTLLPVDGVCGSSNGQTFTSVPTANLCSAGTPTSVSGSGPWTWSCTGLNGGTTANCSANIAPVNGVCGSANGGTFTSVPTTNLCSAGTQTSVTGSGPWYWSCLGLNGGTTAGCSANIQSSGSAELGFPVLWGVVTGVGGSSSSNGVPFAVTATITNTGNAAAGSFTVKAYISASSILGPGAQLLYTWNVSGLAVGQSLTLTSSALSYSGLPVHSYYYIIVKVDADTQITENNEANCGYPATVGCNTFAYPFFIYR